MMATHNTFLALPREIRDQIIGQLFFPVENESRNLEQDDKGLADTAQRQIFPYHPDAWRRPKFDVAILRVCRQIQAEGEAILYGTSSFNLMYDDYAYRYRIKLSYHFFEQLPKRLRRLIQRVERKCYSQEYVQTISLFEWDAFMRFLAEECPALHTLRLWGPGDCQESREWVMTCTEDHAWVQSVLRIKTLHHFDIPVIQGGSIYSYPKFRDRFLPWLHGSLTTRKQLPDVRTLKPVTMKPFRLLDLPLELQRNILRQVVLSDNRRIHMRMKSWFNKNAQDALSMMLTCKKIYIEAGTILYEESIFQSDFWALAGDRFPAAHLTGIPARICTDWQARKVDEMTFFTASSRFQMRHLEFHWNWMAHGDGHPNRSHIWNLQLASITMHIEKTASAMMVKKFTEYLNYRDDERTLWAEIFSRKIQTVARLKKSVPRDQWRVGRWNPGNSVMSQRLAWFLARNPNVKLYHAEPPYKEVTDEYAIWLTKGLREELLRGEPSLPGIEWLFDDPPELGN